MKSNHYWININPPTDENKKSKVTWSVCHICKKKLLVSDTDYWLVDKNNPYGAAASDSDFCSPLCVELGIIELMK
jgi:hypothetical protein